MSVTIIEIKPHRNRWKVFEAPGVEPVFLEKNQAINYAQNRASFRSGESLVFNSTSQSWILAGERSSLLTRIAATESGSLCVRMKR